MRIFLLALLMISSVYVNAAAPTCHENSGGNYCTYTGLVKRVYINESGLILIYFDAYLPEGVAEAVGFSIAYRTAAGYLLQNNSEFAKLLYSTALAAKASGLPLSMQMRGVVNGYLKMDKVWIE